MNFRITDTVESNNIFTEDRSALKVKTNTNVLTRSGPAPLEPSSIQILNKSKSREFDVSDNILSILSELFLVENFYSISLRFHY